MIRSSLSCSLAATVLGGCGTPTPSVLGAPSRVHGHVSFAVPARYATQATVTEVADNATVSLIDPVSGRTLASSITDATGNFLLSFPDFTPQQDNVFTLEAVKGLARGHGPNGAGTAAVRIRTLLSYRNGWLSLTNGGVNQPIDVSSATTAVAVLVSLKQTPGSMLDIDSLIGKLHGNTLAAAGTGLSASADFQPMLDLVGKALAADEDPVGVIALDPATGQYSRETSDPVVHQLALQVPKVGGTVSVTGAEFDPTPGANLFFFGAVPAPAPVFSADRSTVTIIVPPGAYTGPFTLREPNGDIQVLNPMLRIHGTVGTLAGNGAGVVTDGDVFHSSINGPEAITVDAAGNVFTGEWNDGVIRKITPDGIVTTVAGNPAGGSANGTGAAASFGGLVGLTHDDVGNLYAADYGNSLIRKITSAGVVTTLAGGGPAGQDGVGSAAGFSGPAGIIFDGHDTLYVDELSASCVRSVSISSGQTATLAGNGTGADIDGFGTAASLNGPYGLTMDQTQGLLYVSERNGLKVRVIKVATGQVSTLAGSGIDGRANGQGALASFSDPEGITRAPDGNLYLMDMGNNAQIRKITPGGLVSTFAGTTGGGFGDGTFLGSSFRSEAITAGLDGALYVSDYGNNRIRVLVP